MVKRVLLFLVLLLSMASMASDKINDGHLAIYMKLPLLFNDYNGLLKLTRGDYIYPGSFTMDDENNVYIQYILEPKQNDNIIVSYDKHGKYLGYHKIASGGKGGAGEGIAVIKNESGKKIVYVISNNGMLQSYLLSDQPFGGNLPRKSSVFLNGYNQFSFYNGNFIIESYDGPRTVKNSRNNLVIYSKDLDVIRRITLPTEYSGYIVKYSNSTASRFNKRQGIALSAHFFVASYGAYYSHEMSETPDTFQGVRVFSLSGRMLYEDIIKPKLFMSYLINNNLSVSRVENEGVFVDDEYIYQMYVYSDRYHQATSRKEGIVILKSAIPLLIN